MASVSHENADMLSLGDSKNEKYSDIEEIFGNKIITKSSTICNADVKKLVRGIKHKTQTPGFHEKKHVLNLRNEISNARNHLLG